MLWMYDNKADAGTWTSTNASDVYFPPSNLQNFLAAKVWKSGNADGTEYLTLDLGANTSPNVLWYLVVHAHNFQSVMNSSNVLLVEANNTNAWGAPAWTWNIDNDHWGVDPITGEGTAFVEVPANVAGNRYWRFTMIKNAPTDQVQIGRVSLGPGLDTGNAGDPDFGSLVRSFAELTNKDSSIQGQVYAEQRAQFKRIKGNLSVTPEATAALLRLVWPTVGTWKPFFLQVATDSGFYWYQDTLGKPFYVRMGAPVDEKLFGRGDDYLWSIPLSFEEQL